MLDLWCWNRPTGIDVTINPLNNTLDAVDFDGHSILRLNAMHWGK